MSSTENIASHRNGFTMVHVMVAAVVSGMLAVMGTVSLELLGGDDEEEVELAPYMSRAQGHSQKLGFAIAARNQPLASFYLHEIEETFEEVEREVPVHSGVPIAQYVSELISPAFEPFEKALEAKDWGAVRENYVALINRCNACHTKAEYEFIEILPASGKPPYNQKF